MIQVICGIYMRLLARRSLRVVCVVTLIAGAFVYGGMCDAYALSETVELNKIVKDEKRRIEQSARADIDMGKILDVDDSEAFPSIEEKAKANVNEREQFTENTEEPMVSVSTERRSPGNKVLKLFNLGVYYQKQGNTVKAIEEYGRVLELDPDNAEAHNNLGTIYKEQDDLDKAMEHFQHVVSFNPGMDEAHNNLGLIHYLRGNHRNAMLEYKKALKLNPDNLISQMNLGLVYKAQGLDKKAIDTIENVLSEDPFHPEAHYNLAILYEELGHLEKATWHYTRFIDNAGKGHLALTENVTERINDLKVISGDVLRE